MYMRALAPETTPFSMQIYSIQVLRSVWEGMSPMTRAGKCDQMNARNQGLAIGPHMTTLRCRGNEEYHN